MKPYDLVRAGERFWEIKGVYLGAVKQESVAHIEPIGFSESTEGECIVPVRILETLDRYAPQEADDFPTPPNTGNPIDPNEEGD